MGQFKILTLLEQEEWKQILQFFPKADVYYYPEYVTSFYQNGDGTPWCLYYEDDMIGLQAVNIVMVRPVPNPNHETDLEQYVDFVTPYGYGGFLVNEGMDGLNDAVELAKSETDDGEKLRQAMKTLCEDYEVFCREHNVVAEFVRFSPMIENAHEVDDLYQVIDLGHTVWIDTSTPEIIWQNITSKNRNMIRKADRKSTRLNSSH